MNFKRINPDISVKDWVECYWIIENDDPTPTIQKIIPDGFPEIIFHFGDPYRINLGSGWEVQSKNLLAGQISKHFFLQNTGKSSILGIKLKPTTLTHLFGIRMNELTDRVENLINSQSSYLKDVEKKMRLAINFDERVVIIDDFFSSLNKVLRNHTVDNVIALMVKEHGMKSISSITSHMGLSERQLERLFKKYVGLSPKFYSRIIRFNAIFQLREKGDPDWVDLAYEAGYADQAHFIRNFKAFTGDDPTSYGFNERNMANFFLKKR